MVFISLPAFALDTSANNIQENYNTQSLINTDVTCLSILPGIVRIISFNVQQKNEFPDTPRGEYFKKQYKEAKREGSFALLLLFGGIIILIVYFAVRK